MLRKQKRGVVSGTGFTAEKKMTAAQLAYGFGMHILPFLPWSIIAFGGAMILSSANDGQRKRGILTLATGVVAFAGYVAYSLRPFF